MRHPFAALRDEYARLWQTMAMGAEAASAADAGARRLLREAGRYRQVESASGVPALVIMAIHERESAGNFRCHLHNGDPLSRRTIHVPAGRPPTPPPWSWEVSAADALSIDGLSTVRDWSIERGLFQLELYNGFGPRNRGIHTGYLWAGTHHYRRGKYTADGRWDANHVDKQLGCAPLMARIIARDPSLALPGMPAVNRGLAIEAPAPAPVGLGAGVERTRSLQSGLNRLGVDPPLAVDGSYGRHTRRAVEAFQRGHDLVADGLAGPKTLAVLEAALRADPKPRARLSPPLKPETNMAAAQTTVVPIRPATESKINWTNIVSAVAVVLTAATGGKFGLTAEQQAAAVAVLGTVTPVVTVVLRTWFTKSITPAAAASAGGQP